MTEVLDKLFKTLSSLKLTIGVILALGVASIPGTLVDPQKATYDFYHSWWFTSLLFLLTLNLIACTFYRKQSRLSVIMIHSSIFFIFLGGIAGSRFGFRGSLNLEDGQTASAAQRPRSIQKIPLPFEVRSDGFRLRHYAGMGNRPSDYESDLVIVEDGQEKIKKTIRVNDPLRYQGISFYQASYGEIPKGFLLKVRDQEKDKILREARVGFESPIRLPEAGLVFRVVDYTPNFEGFGPAALIQWDKPKGPPERWVVFKNYPNFEAKRRGRYLPILAGVEASYYTGLEVVKDPGVPLVWIGCSLLTLGITLGLLSPKWRRFDLLVRAPKEPKTDMALAGGGASGFARAEPRGLGVEL